MKKFIPLIIISFIIVPAVCFSSYLIELNNGSTFITNHYWKNKGQIKFYFRGGVVGVGKDFVKTIVESDVTYKEKIDSKQDSVDLTSKNNGKSDITTKEKKANGTVDLKYYMKKKIELTAKLDETLERLREATRNKDIKAKNEARDKMRAISTKIYNLTDEVKEKNNGTLPEGWWEKE